jgi:hypothetical protein
MLLPELDDKRLGAMNPVAQQLLAACKPKRT